MTDLSNYYLLARNAYLHASAEDTVLILGDDKNTTRYNQIGLDSALELIIHLIGQIKSLDEFNKFSVGWFYTDDEYDFGDVVVSIYSADEQELESFASESLEQKANCYNDEVAHEYIMQALSTKYNELKK